MDTLSLVVSGLLNISDALESRYGKSAGTSVLLGTAIIIAVGMFFVLWLFSDTQEMQL